MLTRNKSSMALMDGCFDSQKKIWGW